MTSRFVEEFEVLLRKATARNARTLFLTAEEEPAIRNAKGEIETLGTELLSTDVLWRIAESTVGTERLRSLGREEGQIRGSCCIEGEVNGWLTITLSSGAPAICVRLMPGTIPSLDEIRLPEAFRAIIKLRWGLVLLSGPVGAGMQTTAYSILDHINANTACHICTVEVPIAARLTPKRSIVHQIGVGDDAPEFADAMLAAYSQDTDVLYLAEIPTLDIVRACFNWVLTGHLVIAVLHVTDCPERAIQQIVGAFPEAEQEGVRRNLAETLQGICAQRLLPGTHGAFVPAYATLIPDAEMRASIANGSDPYARKTPLPSSCLRMKQDIAMLLETGAISADTARKFGVEPDDSA